VIRAAGVAGHAIGSAVPSAGGRRCRNADQGARQLSQIETGSSEKQVAPGSIREDVGNQAAVKRIKVLEG